jgi:hypothetical protein
LLRLLLIASKHVVEEVELGLGNGCQQEEGPNGREQIAQHFVKQLKVQRKNKWTRDVVDKRP